MSAVPKKKLCWNCEGNVARQVDNCPYCGVYLHAEELLEEDTSWNPSYRPSSKSEGEIPSPIYQIQQDQEAVSEETTEEPVAKAPKIDKKKKSERQPWNHIFTQLQKDVFPALFLMMGSIFFLFGIVLLLFAQNGTLTLQWKGSYAPYFLLFSLPLVFFGWRFLQKLDVKGQ